MLLFQNNDGTQHEIVELSKMPAGAKVQRMLSAFKQYKRRVFKPDAGVSVTDVYYLVTWLLADIYITFKVTCSS